MFSLLMKSCNVQPLELRFAITLFSLLLEHCVLFATTHHENERTDVMMQIKLHKAVKTRSVRFH